MKSLASAQVLSETRERLLHLASDDKALWGRMTAIQMVRHLGCAYEVALGERTVQPLKGPPTWLIKWAALRSGFRWPKNLSTTPELLRALDDAPTVGFTKLVGLAVEKMQDLAKGTRWATNHPMFGEMTAADWMRWGYLHADHHLRQFGR